MGNVFDLGAYRARLAARQAHEQCPDDPDQLLAYVEPGAAGEGPYVTLQAPRAGACGWLLTPAEAERLGVLLVQAAVVMRLEAEILADRPPP